MNKIQYIIFNGPPGCGKSICARELALAFTQRGYTNELDSFAKPIKQFFMTALGDKYDQVDKERARPELNGYSLREGLIHLSERYVKERYGDDIFGRWLVHRSLRFPAKKVQFYIVDDGGFEDEIRAVPNAFIVRIVRPGRDFAKDSRNYINPYNYRIDNVGDLPMLWQSINALCVLLMGH